MSEEWKSIPEYEDLYEVSNLGNIRSLDRTTPRRTRWGVKGFVTIKGQILCPIERKDGYLSVTLCKNGKNKNYLIHRIVTTAFIPNPDNLSTVNHINEDKRDNRISNLEWMSLNDNLHYGTGIERGHSNRDRKWHREHKDGLNPNAKKIIQLTKDGKFIKEWDCIKKASEKLGICMTSICAVARGKAKTAGNYKWQYKL